MLAMYYALTDPSHSADPEVCVKNPQQDRFISYSLVTEGVWEQEEVTNVLSAVLRASNSSKVIFLDLGANIGVFSLAVAHLLLQLKKEQTLVSWPRVLAVEAMADNLAYLKASVQANGFPPDLVTLVHHSLSDVEELMYPVGFPDGDPTTNPGAILFVKEEHLIGRKVLGPPTSSVTLPHLLATLPPASTVIIKMDIEGQECRVLNAPGVFESGHSIPYIFMEWRTLVILGSCPSLAALVSHLEDAGYRPR